MPEVGDTRSVKLAEGVEMTFCWIPPGRFRMGSRGEYVDEQPVHAVEIMRGFWLGRTPVTQREFAAFDPKHQNGFPGNPEHAAENMDWNRAVAFCEWLTGRLSPGAWDGWAASLPSDAQWEYACRAGMKSDYHTGDGEAALRASGWFKDNAGRGTQPVGQLEANSFGLHDMHGNVDEWCRDRWREHAYRTNLTKKTAVDPDSARVIGGGAWDVTAGGCRAALRIWCPASIGIDVLGFRVGLFLSPSCQGKPGDSDGSVSLGGRRAVSAQAADGEDRIKDHDMEETINEIALSSLDGRQWHDAHGQPIERDRIQGCVTRVVIGELKADKPINISEAIGEQLREHWQTITHLHFWSIGGLTTLSELPSKLKCLDLRNCGKIESLPELPETLETLDLEGCTALKKLPAGDTRELRFLHLDHCIGLKPSAVNGRIGSCSCLEELTLSGCTQLHELGGLENIAENEDPPLRKLVLKGCEKLQTLPELSVFGRLNHLNLNGCKALETMPWLPILEDPNPPRAYNEPVRGLRYLVTHDCENLREYRGLDLRPVHLSEGPDDNIIDTMRALHFLGQPPAELLSSKLLLLGSGRVGKTTLAKALQWGDLDKDEREHSERGKQLDPREGSTSTHGIQFWPWECEFELPNSDERRRGRVHIWDFAGQEIYHNTHRLFAASGSVFVIVCCDRDTHAARLQDEIALHGLTGAEREAFERENEYREVRYWLDYVRAGVGLKPEQAGRMPVIIVHSASGADGWEYVAEQAGPYGDLIRRRALPVVTLDFEHDEFPENSDFIGLRAELARRLGASADQLGIRVPAFYRDVHAAVEALLKQGRPRRDQAVFAFDKWKQYLADTLGESRIAAASSSDPAPAFTRAQGRAPEALAEGTGYPSLAFSPSVLRAATRHLHRIGQVFWLEDQSGGDVIIDQALGANTLYALCRSSNEADQLRHHAGLINEDALQSLLDEVQNVRDTALDSQKLLQLLAKCEVCLPVDAGQWQALNPALLPELNSVIRKEIGQQWFELLGQAPDSVNHSFRLSGKAGMKIGAADMQAVLAWLVKYGISGDEGQRLPFSLVQGEDDSYTHQGNRKYLHPPVIHWRSSHQFWRNGAQIVWTPEFREEFGPHEGVREPERGESPGDAFLLRIQYAPFEVENRRGERAVSYEGSLYVELLSRDEAGMAPRLRQVLMVEGGPLSFLRKPDDRQIDDQRPQDLSAERIGHPRDSSMLPWRCARSPSEPVKRHQVAISTRGFDADIAEPLYRALRREGLLAYYYRDDERARLRKEGGESGMIEIYDYLDQAECLILVCSNGYFDLTTHDPHSGNIYCPVELAAVVASVQPNNRSRDPERVFQIAVSRDNDRFSWGRFEEWVEATLKRFKNDVIDAREAGSEMRRRERDWVERACDDFKTFKDLCGGQAKQNVRWDGKSDTREAAINEMVAKIKAALGQR